MKHLQYLMMCVYIISFFACTKKEGESHQTQTEKHIHEHSQHKNHEHTTEAENVIIFTHEQAKNTLDFQVEKIMPQTFYQIIKTSGQILSAPGDESVISATLSGIVTIVNTELLEGVPVSKGQRLFSISGNDLSENNYTARLIEAKALLENTKIEYERTSILVDEQIISQKEFQSAKLAYEQARANYNALSAGIYGNGKSITSPMNGYMKNLLVRSGQYVEIGQALGVITQNKRLILRADVSQRYLSNIKYVQTASFTTPYDNKTYELSELNGRLLSIGKSSDGNSFYTPVNFEFDNKSNIIEGSFVEIYLKSQPIADVIAVPISALIEEQGHFFVFVQQEDDDEYIKQEVIVGMTDGIKCQILRGLKSEQKIVINGAYAIKLASLSGAMPEHSHEH